MAVDPSDTLDPPYGLGECAERAYPTSISCNTMFTENSAMISTIPMRKQGDFVQIIVPEIIAKPQSNETDIIQFGLPNDDTWLGKNRVSRRFACVGFNGCEKNVDNMTNEICICQIDIDSEGNVYIAPKGHNEGFTAGANWNDPIGICATTISYLVDDSEPQEEEETEEAEPQTKMIKLG